MKYLTFTAILLAALVGRADDWEVDYLGIDLEQYVKCPSEYQLLENVKNSRKTYLRRCANSGICSRKSLELAQYKHAVCYETAHYLGYHWINYPRDMRAIKKCRKKGGDPKPFYRSDSYGVGLLCEGQESWSK